MANFSTDGEIGALLDSTREPTESKINNFQEYGFISNIPGRILENIDDVCIGWMKAKGEVFAVSISKGGMVSHYNGSFQLEVIKQWYEDTESFPRFLWDLTYDRLIIADSVDKFCNVTLRGIDKYNARWERFRLPTDQEIKTLNKGK